MTRRLFSGLLLFALAASARAADVCYRVRVDAMKEEFHVVYLTPGGALEGWAGGCTSCWAGIGLNVVGGVPADRVPLDPRFKAFDLAFQVINWGTAHVRCLRAHCLLRASEACADSDRDPVTRDLARYETADIPAQSCLDIVVEERDIS